MIQRAEGPQCLGWRRSGLVDGSLTEDVRDRALAHLSSCPDCADDVEVERLLTARLRALPDPVPSARLMAALMQMGETGGPMPPRPGHVPGMPRPRPVPLAVGDVAGTVGRLARPVRAPRPSRETRAPRSTRPGRSGRPAAPARHLVPGLVGRTADQGLSRGARRTLVSGAVGLVGAGILAFSVPAWSSPAGGAGPVTAAGQMTAGQRVEPEAAFLAAERPWAIVPAPLGDIAASPVLAVHPAPVGVGSALLAVTPKVPVPSWIAAMTAGRVEAVTTAPRGAELPVGEQGGRTPFAPAGEPVAGGPSGVGGWQQVQPVAHAVALGDG